MASKLPMKREEKMLGNHYIDDLSAFIRAKKRNVFLPDTLDLGMPRQNRKTAKSDSTPPQCAPTNRTTSVNYSVLKRAQLQQLCKKLGIRATGKNSELLERVKAFHEEPLCEILNTKEENTKKNGKKDQKLQAPLPASPVVLNKEIKSEKKTEVVRGWCVVHGMVLYRPESSWFPLLLRGGMVYVQDGENHVSFHLPVTNISVPEGLSDNYICGECVLRNEEKLKKRPMNQQIRGKGDRVSLPKIALKNVIPCQDSTAQPSLLATNTSKDKRRTVEIRKLYQPQEDEAYAQRVSTKEQEKERCLQQQDCTSHDKDHYSGNAPYLNGISAIVCGGSAIGWTWH